MMMDMLQSYAGVGTVLQCAVASFSVREFSYSSKLVQSGGTIYARLLIDCPQCKATLCSYVSKRNELSLSLAEMFDTMDAHVRYNHV